MGLIDQKRPLLYNFKMKNIFAKTQPVEFVSNQTDLRNWRFLGMEMESLGARLDAAREALSRADSAWSRWYWQETLDRLMIQWRHFVPLHDGDARMQQMPRWATDYKWWEGTQEPTYTGLEGITDALFAKVFRSDDLNAVWNRHRDARIMKCNCQ
jgi:hypothetical protein